MAKNEAYHFRLTFFVKQNFCGCLRGWLWGRCYFFVLFFSVCVEEFSKSAFVVSSFQLFNFDLTYVKSIFICWIVNPAIVREVFVVAKKTLSVSSALVNPEKMPPTLILRVTNPELNELFLSETEKA